MKKAKRFVLRLSVVFSLICLIYSAGAVEKGMLELFAAVFSCGWLYLMFIVNFVERKGEKS